MKQVLRLSLVAIALAGIVVSSAVAVQYGEPDGDRHPAVGLVVFHDASGVPQWRCTGTLVDADTFLTAGHCAESFTVSKAVIWFAAGPIPYSATYPGGGAPCGQHQGYPCTGDAVGKPISHPNWNGGLTIPNTHDVGVVQLTKPLKGHPTMAIASASYLDRLATARGTQDTTFRVVGYGLQSVKPFLSAERTRMYGEVSLVNLTSALNDGYNVQYTSNPGEGNGSGGTCFGDSGGPVIHWDGTKEVIVGVNSFVLNSNCKGAGFAFRVDTAVSRDFLSKYTKLP